MTDFFADDPDWHLLILILINEAVPRSINSIDTIPADEVVKMTHLDLQNRFPIFRACPCCLAALLCCSTLRKNVSAFFQESDEVGIDTRWLVTWECPLRIRSASWKSFESFMRLISFCNSCILPVSSRIVSWFSTNLRLAIVSNVELWNFLNSPISVKLFWWASRCVGGTLCRTR